MSLRLQIVLIITSIIGGYATIYLIKKNVLELKYALVWIFVACGALVLPVFPSILNYISQIVGTQVPVNTLFLFGFYFVFFILFTVTIIVSKNAQRVKILNQEIAILKAQIDSLEKMRS